MLFNADIREKLHSGRSKSWKTKKSKRNFHQKVDVKQKFTLIQDLVNSLSNNRPQRFSWTSAAANGKIFGTGEISVCSNENAR